MIDPWKNYNHESERNLEIQGSILIQLIVPMTIKDLKKKMLIEHRISKTDVIRNLNYLMVRKMAVVRRKNLYYLEKNDPGRYIRKHGGKEE